MMLLLDANILMYMAGRDHPHKAPCVALLRQVALGEVPAAIDTEALQEILHRYGAIGRRSEGLALYDMVRAVVPVIVPVTAEVMDETRRLLAEVPRASARDAVHAAVARLHNYPICSYDRDMEQFSGVVRVEP